MEDLERAAREQMKEFRKALEFFNLETGDYPETRQALTEPRMDSDVGTMNSIPADPWGEAYVYCLDDGEVVLFSKGADGVAGTEDDVFPN
ncbi:MAG: type II secretion system protein GspG [Planctomycetota bacterium]